MRRKILTTAIGVVLAAAILIVAVSMVEVSGKQTEIWKNGEKDSLTTIGFSQVGAESDWRSANSISMKRTFTPERGYDLIFEDAKQKQSDQIKACLLYTSRCV